MSATWTSSGRCSFYLVRLEINEARILTFGYNANFRPGSSKNKMSVLDFAKDLLYDLKYARGNSVLGLEDLRMGEVRSPAAHRT